MNKGIIGIVGGMGPVAGITLAKNIISQTLALNDQEHLPQILFSLPENIPDRTEFILGKINTNPATGIMRILMDMELIGVSYAALACNSAHAPQIFNVIKTGLENRKTQLKLFHMIEEVGSFIKTHFPEQKKVGILGTTGTCKTRLYDILNKYRLETIYLAEKKQEKLHKAIYHPIFGVKSNSLTIPEETVKILSDAINSLIKAGAELIVLGCTELSLVYTDNNFQGFPVIDSSLVLARALINAHSPAKLKPWN